MLSRMNVAVEIKGTIFDNAASKAAAARFVIAMNEMLAQEGVRRVKTQLGHVLRNPTGYYQSRITVERRQIFRGITDQNVPYGSWLEGTSRRNRTTRFKGYHTFAIIGATLQQDRNKLVEPAVRAFIREVNS